MYSGALAAERRDQRSLHLRVRAMVGAADHVRDLEVEIVDRGRELIGRRAVRAQERRLPESERALRRRARRSGAPPRGAARSARSGSSGPSSHAMPSHSRSAAIASAPPSTFRAASVSSIRSRKAPPCSSAKRRFATALSAPPRWSDPVGLGAKRTRTMRARYTGACDGSRRHAIVPAGIVLRGLWMPRAFTVFTPRFPPSE